MNEIIIQHCQLLQSSYERLTGKQLINGSLSDMALFEAMYHAPFVIVSHNTELDPVFNFANITAQQLWEMDWEEFTQLPSRKSAPPISIAEREKLLQQARQKGFIDNYSGIRISKSGKQFYIRNTFLWNITNEQGLYYGQAAVFGEWEWL